MYMRIFKFLVLGTALGVLAGLSGHNGQLGLAQNCSIVVFGNQLNQRVIDQVPAGAIICVMGGEAKQSLRINKSLTLLGVSKTVIESSAPGYPALRIESQAEIDVTILGITFVGAPDYSDTRECVLEAPIWTCPDVIDIRGQARVTLLEVALSEGRDGLHVEGAARVVVKKESIIDENRRHGVFVRDSARVALTQKTRIQSNGTSDRCSKPEVFCNGIEVQGQGVVELTDARIWTNTDWGISAMLKQCGYKEDNFTGQVIIEGETLIDSNNRSGNQTGMGNPGSHPWNRPEVLDGQVCLP